MDTTLRHMALAAFASLALGTTAAQAQGKAEGLRFLVSPGVGFGTSGVHAYGKGDSKPGGYLIGRAGLARKGRPFIVGEGEFQLYDAPYPADPADGRPVAEIPKTSFTAISALVGVALYPAADFYLMPQAGIQARNWQGEEAPTGSGSGFAAGLIAGYHLSFAEGFSMQPELVLRYADVTGPGSPSFRMIAFRLMATWVF